MQRVFEVVRKEFRQMRRDRHMAPFLFIVPVMQLILFGYAISTDVKHLRVAVCDLDRTAESRDFIREMLSSEYFDLVGTMDRQADARRWLDDGRASLVLVVPLHFQRDARGNQTAPVQVLLDGSDANTGTVAMGYLAGLIQARAARWQVERLRHLGMGRPAIPGIEPETRVWYNPTLATALFMVPGVMCVIIGLVATVSTALTIVHEREIGTMEQLIVTPLRSWELMVGKTLPFLFVGYTNIAFILVANSLLFHVPLRGSLALLLGIAALFLCASLGIGLFISTVSHTQQQAMMTAFFFLMPNFLLSGFIFPIENMPWVLQLFTYVLPMRYFLVITRDIFLRGSGFALVADQVWPLAVLTALIMTVSVLRFQKRLD